jgi:ubiquinone/menaquinone biosynthesis C-methylase UbiE
MVSDTLPSLVRCPDCEARFVVAAGVLRCGTCGRTADTTGAYLDLRPKHEAGASTKYLDDALHADGRQSSVSPPLLSAGIRNDMMRRFLRPGPADRLVDLGCGSGRMMLWNRASGAHMVGVDVSPHFAAESLDSVDLVLGDLRRLPRGDAGFTKAYAFDVAEHLTRDGLDTMLGEAARVLTAGGHLFLYSHVRQNSRLALGLRAINRLAAFLDRVGAIDLRQERLRKSDHINPLADLGDLEETVGKAGFRIVRIRYYTPLVGAFIENILLRLVEGTLTRRAARRLARQGAAASDSVPLVRAQGKRLAGGRITGAVLRTLTWLMKIDLALFGRVKSGPFFVLLEKRAP